MNFKFWLREKWYEHLAELDSFGIRCKYDQKYYFNKYRWWLKREFQYQQKNNVL